EGVAFLCPFALSLSKGALSAVLAVSRQLGQQQPIPVDQRLLLRPAPALDLSLSRQRFMARWKVLRPDEPNRSAPARVARISSTLVLTHANFEIFGVAGVE